jgi:hypothetical protein
LLTISGDITQPLLIIFEENMEIKQIYIKLDRQSIQIKNNDFIYCLDILFKIFWIFNLEYSIQTENVMYCLECIYELDISTKRPSVDSHLFAILELSKEQA